LSSCFLACGGALSSLSGVITSPGFNSSVTYDGYSANEECIWTINHLQMIGSPSTINLQFTHLHTESHATTLSGSSDGCKSDFVEIRAGKEATDPIVQTTCGKKSDLKSDTLAIPGHSVWLRFRTDFSSQLSGFMITYNISGQPFKFQKKILHFFLKPGILGKKL
jgi:CUB domain